MWRSSIRPFRAVFGNVAKSSQSNVVADTTFSYRTIPWRTSEGQQLDYQCVVAAPPEHHSLPKSERLSFALIPSLDLCTAGKEDLRPLAKELSDLGHWSYLLEWPGWTNDGQINWAFFQCKLEHLREEYEDFWHDIMTALKTEDGSFRVVASGDLAASIIAQPCQDLNLPARKLEVPSRYTKRWSPRWNKLLSNTLQGDGRIAKRIQWWYFNKALAKKLREPILKHDGVTIEMLEGRHTRPRPLTHTDMALICGHLDVKRDVQSVGTSATALTSLETWRT
eukprot:GEMP01070140.1.p1 GENE.GEMP01070140.1~~GEMP01070140.1.p1  ORF type:complete len:280 (-),score=38.92 GEMP01070140.1:264-1103(-)